MRAWIRAAAAALAAYAALPPTASAQETRRKQEITFPELRAHNVGDAPFAVSAKATSGLPVSLVVVSGPASLEKNELTLAGSAGLVIIRASQPGNAVFLPAQPVTRVLVVNPTPTPPRIATQPAGGPYEIGDAVTLFVEVSGEPAPALQWRRDGSPLSGATGRKLTIMPAAPTDSGDYDVVASNPLGSATSERARVTVGKRRQTIAFEGPFRVVVGVPVTLSANATSGLPVKFEIASGTAVMSGSSLTAQGPGTVVVRLTQPGDATFAEAAAVIQPVSVAAQP